MGTVYGVGIAKGGQGKSTTASTLARLCASRGARVLLLDLAQPGTTTASLRDIWPAHEHETLSQTISSLRPAKNGAPDAKTARVAIQQAGLPVMLSSQPSWSGGHVLAFPWDEDLGDTIASLASPRVISGLLAALSGSFDIALIDWPAESGPLMANALHATDKVIMPLTPETPALEGAYWTLRLMSQARQQGSHLRLGGIFLTRIEPKSKRTFEVVQAISNAGEVEGEQISKLVFPFGLRTNEFFEQAFRYGEPVWERTNNPSHWASYVLLSEWLLRDAGLTGLAAPGKRNGPSLISGDTRIFDVTALVMDSAEIAYADFARVHPGV
jgi:cellulose biosynthesis protein BcsQ